MVEYTHATSMENMLTVHALHTTLFYYPEQVEGLEENELNEN